MLDVLTQQQTLLIERVLRALVMKAESRAALLCNEAGYILTEACTDSAALEFAQSQNIAALASGSFFATREMARIVGEKEFKCVLHQGQDSGIFIMLVGGTMILVVVFNQKTNPGLVKLFAENAAREVEACFKVAATDSERTAQQSVTFALNDGGLFERSTP